MKSLNTQGLITNLFELFSKQKLTLATAESCTGGILATWLTELPGSSNFYLGGVSSYSYESKEIFLGVSHQDLVENGAVSEIVAKQMAAGVRKQLGSKFAVSITGIAGPDGAMPGKPVGTVWIAVSGPRGEFAKRLNLQGDRSEVRRQSAQHALEFLMDEVKR